MTADFGAAAAAVLYGAGAVVLLGVRGWRHKRMTGSSGFNVLAADRDPAARLAGGCFGLALLIGLASPVLAWLHVLPILGRFESWSAGAAVWIGMVLTWIGFGLAVLAQDAMGPSWRVGVNPAERTELVTRGVFAVVRNPIFSSIVVAQLGTALMAPTWLGVAGVVLVVVAVELQARLVEEPYLRRAHAAAYAAYAARTGRFLPGLGRLPAPPD